MGALLAHRPEEEAGEAALTTTSHDEEVGVAGSLEEDVRRSSLDRVPRKFDIVKINRLERGGEDGFRPRAKLLMHLLHGWPGRRKPECFERRDGKAERKHPSVYGVNARPAKPRLGERPSKRFQRPGGAVDADHDLRHSRVIIAVGMWTLHRRRARTAYGELPRRRLAAQQPRTIPMNFPAPELARLPLCSRSP